MDLVLVSSGADVVAVKCGACYNCVEKKLNTTILKVFKKALKGKEYLEWKNNYGLKGFAVECECNHFRSIYSEQTNEQKFSFGETCEEIDATQNRIAVDYVKDATSKGNEP